MSNDKDLQEMRLHLFEKSGLKIDQDDPIIQLYLVQKTLMSDSLLDFQKNINSLGNTLINEIKEQQKEVLSGFDERTDKLNAILAHLDKAKEAIVNDVWAKLEQRVRDQLHKDMQAIANNANNKINNQRNMFIGGIIGLLIGLVLCVILFVLK